MTEQERIADRIAGREVADSVMDLVEWGTGSDAFKEAFVERLSPPKPKVESGWPDVPLARLESMTLPFGKYQGVRLCDVPLDYLQWLVAEQEEFYAMLRAYLRHPDVWRAQDVIES